MIPGNFSSVRGAWPLSIASAASRLISGCALDWRQHISRFRFFVLMYEARDTNSTKEGTKGTRCAEDMRCAVRGAVIIPGNSPDDSGGVCPILERTSRGTDNRCRKTGDHSRHSGLPGARCVCQYSHFHNIAKRCRLFTVPNIRFQLLAR